VTHGNRVGETGRFLHEYFYQVLNNLM